MPDERARAYRLHPGKASQSCDRMPTRFSLLARALGGIPKENGQIFGP